MCLAPCRESRACVCDALLLKSHSPAPSCVQLSSRTKFWVLSCSLNGSLVLALCPVVMVWVSCCSAHSCLVIKECQDYLSRSVRNVTVLMGPALSLWIVLSDSLILTVLIHWSRDMSYPFIVSFLQWFIIFGAEVCVMLVKLWLILFLSEMLAVAIVFLISFSAISLLDEYLGRTKHESKPCNPSTQTRGRGIVTSL